MTVDWLKSRTVRTGTSREEREGEAKGIGSHVEVRARVEGPMEKAFADLGKMSSA